MNNSLSSGNSVLSSMLPAQKNQTPSANSSAREVSTREADRFSSARDAADFRATMSEIANAKTQARRENLERAANKKSDQVAATQERQERVLDKERSLDKNRPQGATSGATTAKLADQETIERPPKKADTLGDQLSGMESGLVTATDSPLKVQASTDCELLLSADLPVQTPLIDVAVEDAGAGSDSQAFSLLADLELSAESSIPAGSLNPDGTSLPLIAADAVMATGHNLAADKSLTGENARTPAAPVDVNAKSVVVSGELTVDTLAMQESRTASKSLPDGGSAMTMDDTNTPFGKLLASVQDNRDGQALNQELAAVKTAAANPQILELSARPADIQAPATRGFVVQTGVPLTMGQPRWGEAVGERVLWLAAQNVSSAELRLDPPELGPMQVRISIHQDQATISFSSPHPGVREALDQSAVRLREMFSEQGLNLVNVDVSDQPMARHQSGDNSSGGRAGHGADAETVEEEAVVGVTANLASIRLVDHYA